MKNEKKMRGAKSLKRSSELEGNTSSVQTDDDGKKDDKSDHIDDANSTLETHAAHNCTHEEDSKSGHDDKVLDVFHGCLFYGLMEKYRQYNAENQFLLSWLKIKFVERTDGDLYVGDVGLGVDGDKDGAELLACFEVDEVAGEVAVDVGLGVDVEVVEVGIGFQSYHEAAVALPGLADVILWLGVGAVFGIDGVILLPAVEVDIVGKERLRAVVESFPVAIVVDAAP